MRFYRRYPLIATAAGRLSVRLLEKISCWDDALKRYHPAVYFVIRLSMILYSRIRRPTWRPGKLPWIQVGLSEKESAHYYELRLKLALEFLRCLRKSEKAEISAESWPSLPWGRKPVLLLGLHLGNFEAILRHLGEHPPSRVWRGGLFAPTFSAPFTDWLRAKREAMGLQVLLPGNASALRIWIRKAGILGTMADQGQEAARWEPFPGVFAPWPESLLRFARSQGAWVLAASAAPDGGSRTKIQFGPAWELDGVSDENFKAEFSDWSAKTIAETPLLFDWSYPRLRIDAGRRYHL